MCGIAGVLGGDRPDAKPLIQTLAHRGPDCNASYDDADVSLGHARLSIIDLSTNANQPMVDDATGTVIVFNGEIYNFQELRSALEARGDRFVTQSDTEVILRGFLRDGIQSFARLNGMFAFAIWSPRKRQLVLARDEIGIKPLYLHEANGVLRFASESKALLSGLAGLAFDPSALAAYLRFHYIPGDRTLVQGIRRFPAGEAWEIDVATRQRRSTVIRYRPAKDNTPLAGKALRRAVLNAVERQMVADVPVGAFLSGGIDSSIVTMAASRVAASPIETFSVGFDHGFSEVPLAAEYADALGARNTPVRVTGEAAIRDFGAMTWHYDGPLGEGGCIPNYYIAREARRKVTVVLAGEGGDEIFGGYPWHAQERALSRATRFVPKAAILSRPAARLRGRFGRGVEFAVRRTWIERYSVFMEVYGPGDLSYADLPVPALGPVELRDPLDTDQKTLLRDCYLVKADTMTMASSLEERVPLLDLELFGAQGRMFQRVAPRKPSKWLLREAFKEDLPEAVLHRPKRGYGTPMKDWIGGAFKEPIAMALQEPLAVKHGLVPQKTWDRLVTRGERITWHATTPHYLLFALDQYVAQLRRHGHVGG